MLTYDDPSMTPGPRNRIVRMIVMHWILGGALGIACAGVLLLLDVMHIRTLLFRSDALVPGIFMLVVGFGTTFGGVVAATAVMLQKKDDDDGPPPGGLRERILGAPAQAPALAPVRSSRVQARWR